MSADDDVARTLLRADEWIEVRGKPVAVFKAGRLPADEDHPRALLGKTLIIDGRYWRVTGVEAHAVVDVRGQPFGLVVESRDPEPWPINSPYEHRL